MDLVPEKSNARGQSALVAIDQEMRSPPTTKYNACGTKMRVATKSAWYQNARGTKMRVVANHPWECA